MVLIYSQSSRFKIFEFVILGLKSDDEPGEVDVKAIKLELDLVGSSMQQKVYQKADLAQHQKSKAHSTRQEPEQNGSSYILSCNQSSTTIMDQQLSPTNDAILSSTLPQSSIPICRQFWKAGNYEDGLAFKPTLKNGSYLHIHPKFLHSNATSHKWAFGAIAELLDNAVDEIKPQIPGMEVQHC